MAKYVERDVEFEDDVPIAPTIIIYYYSYIIISIIFYLLNLKLVYSLLYIIIDTLCGLLYYIFEF